MRNVVNAAPTPGEALEPATERDAPAVGTPVDFGFLAAQTFGDLDLEREVLALFVAQAGRVVPSLPGLEPQAQTAAAHLLKGSARGIGAWSAAAVAERYEQASQRERATIQADLAATFAAAETAIAERLGAA